MKFSYSIKILSVFTLVLLIGACSKPAVIKTKNNIEPLVSVQWLNAHLEDSNLVVLDTSVIVKPDGKGSFSQVSGRDQYLIGHIPTAGFADLQGELSAESEIDYVMPSPKQFQKAMEKLGVSDDSLVVLYSANNHVWATRLWWMLKWSGFDNVALLDGGLKAWEAAGLPLTTELPTRTKNTLTLNLRPELLADHDEVLAGITNQQVDLIDAMPAAHYQGLFSMYARPGHIMSASNVPTSDLVEQSGLFKTVDDLDFIFESDKNHRAITYCGGGVAATSVAFNLYRSGYSDVAVYMGSLNEWAPNPENPMTVDVDK
jgi:thiosulfate/3-mercaptopyruvate sulfurtransferase